MTFLFPDYETLIQAITSGLVPPAVCLEAGIAGADERGRPWIHTSAAMPRGTKADLERLGVQTAKSAPGEGRRVLNWLQVIPLDRAKDLPAPGSQTPVIFELADAIQLPAIAGEMIRLKNDRQSFRWVTDDAKGTSGVLLRVIGPPYYTLLRALERSPDGKPPIRGYVESTPGSRVWVELGYTHPLLDKIAPADGQMLLLQAPSIWTIVTDAPFRDLYEILEFKLPKARHDWHGVELGHRLKVSLKLISADKAAAELWVLRGNALDQLDTLVREAREHELNRLSFAVGHENGETTVVLRTRPSKQPPPALQLDAIGFLSYLKLPNLFLPIGYRLHPVLRRDAVRRLLAEDPAQITWLRPGDNGTFFPESLPDAAFRPLRDWVDYVLDREQAALHEWLASCRFDFDEFICRDDVPAESGPRPPGSRRRVARPVGDTRERPDDDDDNAPRPARKRDPEPRPSRDDFSSLEIRPPSELERELSALERHYIDHAGALDEAGRLKLLPNIARLNTALRRTAEAAICWSNYLWELPDLDAHHPWARDRVAGESGDTIKAEYDLAGEYLAEWLRSETQQLGWQPGPENLDSILASASPSPAEVRAVAAAVVAYAHQEPVPAAFVKRIPKLQHFLETHIAQLGIRPSWLAGHAIAKLSGDVLGLARLRDRMLERLRTEGLNPERDLPNFLRFAGSKDSDRMRTIRGNFGKLYQAASAWLAECPGEVAKTTQPYADLVFAFGYAKLGEAAEAKNLILAAQEALSKRLADNGKPDPVHQFLLSAFRYRLEQASMGRPHVGPLPLEWRDKLDQALPRGTQPRYLVDRMRQQSYVLEPQEKNSPYRDFTSKHLSPLEQKLITLPDEHDPKKLSDTIRKLFTEGVNTRPTVEEQIRVLAEGLVYSPRVSEAFSQELLSHVLPLMAFKPSGPVDSTLIVNKAILLERALHLAGHFDRTEYVQKFMEGFVQLLRQAKEQNALKDAVGLVAGQCLKCLRKLGLRDEIGKLLNETNAMALGGQSLNLLPKSDPKTWPDILQTMLHLSGGWLYFGWADRAALVIEIAEMAVYSRGDPPRNSDGLFPNNYTKIACTYATVLGQAPAEIALPRIELMFGKMRRIEDTLTSKKYYARMHLNVIEAVVLAIVSDDFAIGPAARRWLDDDEYLVRRRIHADLRSLRDRAGT
jgi:hypothetical protein